ncbi:LOW QUALITY PROTEIN: hypothetical protein OSB04_019839 [Centaurea solstitialis]|uniref:Reverse transcriptase domain-containing protein n=1 Tax=Centaurea solstitialis TaxID=347529 RepID=A0AA38WG96_9ASTR|nr:LOW QUALITY PROTEIN: hypothetical protein OSB04_019839 [Centaurea solstitialis]
MNGMGKETKRRWLKDMVLAHKIIFLCVQETKTVINSDWQVASVWGKNRMDFVALDSVGNSSGILTIWDGNLFQVQRSHKMDGFVTVFGLWRGNNTKLGIINVYAPQGVNCKKNINKELQSEPDAAWVVRCADERKGSVLDIRGTKLFNDFIVSAGLNELRLGGRKFTWMNADCSKFSKLDRYLINQSFLDAWPLSNALALPRVLSDHCPILLETKGVDFGPTPFKLFNSWLNNPDFEVLVREKWNENLPGTANFSKIETLKKNDTELVSIKNKICSIDTLAELSPIDDGLVNDRPELMAKLNDLMDTKIRDIKQRAKNKWLQDGENNTWFFHGCLNNKLSKTKLHGLNINGIWETSPEKIKAEVRDFFEKKFEEHHLIRPTISSSLFKKISALQREWLEAPFSKQEVKNAVWNCGFYEAVKHFETHHQIEPGSNSSFITLIPKIKDPLSLADYRPINLIGCVNKVISKVLAERLKRVLDSVISHNQTAAQHSRWATDVNELITRAKKTRKKLLLFKVDFAKAFDTLNWHFLDHVFSQMGFGDKWRAWMQGCIVRAKVSVLINGSPTKEFRLGEGVRQGDPLAPFLFILAAEGLTIAMKEAQQANILREFGQQYEVSTFQFADDTIFVGDWSAQNAKHLLRVLKCFEVCSGLKINLNKSRLSGVSVNKDEVANMARRLNCKDESIPFRYLGLPVGTNMNLTQHWQPLIEKFRAKLSAWKARTLSIGGRCCLCKSVLGALGTYLFSLYKAPIKVLNVLEGIRRKFLWGGTNDTKKICWMAWDKVIRDKKCGGLGIGSLRALNLALLAKWRWREKTEPNAIWNKLIRSYTGTWCMRGSSRNNRGTWNTIHGVENDLREMGINLFSFLKLNDDGSGWEWELEQNKTYSVRSLRRLIDGVTLPAADTETEWNRWLPNKINIQIWRILNNRMQTRDNLLKRGVNMPSTDCPLCHSSSECLDHVMTSCSTTKVINAHLANWVDCWPRNALTAADFWAKIGSAGDKKRLTTVCKVIRAAYFSTIWWLRNSKVYKGNIKKDIEIVQDIQFTAFNWIRCRSTGGNLLNWESWICNPVNVVASCLL